MNKKAIDLKGKTFGNLYVVYRVDNIVLSSGREFVAWKCKCKCGNEVVVSSNHLKTGHTKSCGCKKKERKPTNFITHGMSHLPEYRIWLGMKNRCYNSNLKEYYHYGRRGIKVCDRWLESFENFYEDMGERPSNRYTIERHNVNGDYGPSNCSWETYSVQSRNKRNLREATLYDPFGKRYDIEKGGVTDFCISHGLSTSCIFAVLNGQNKHHRKWTGYYHD